MNDFLENLERMERATAELRDTVREAHAARKDLEAERRRVTEAVAEARDLVDTELGKLIPAELEKIGPQLTENAQAIYDRVSSEATRLMNISIYGNDEGTGEAIFEAIEKKYRRLDAEVRQALTEMVRP
jgi:hypothetical protein